MMWKKRIQQENKPLKYLTAYCVRQGTSKRNVDVWCDDTIVQSIVLRDIMGTDTKREATARLNAVQIDYTRGSWRVFRPQCQTNDDIKGRMNIQKTRAVKRRQEDWCGCVHRMNSGRRPKCVTDWQPEGKRKTRITNKGVAEGGETRYARRRDWQSRTLWRLRWGRRSAESCITLRPPHTYTYIHIHIHATIIPFLKFTAYVMYCVLNFFVSR